MGKNTDTDTLQIPLQPSPPAEAGEETVTPTDTTSTMTGASSLAIGAALARDPGQPGRLLALDPALVTWDSANPRQAARSPTELAELKEMLLAVGQMSAGLVRPDADRPGRYLGIAGSRRCAAVAELRAEGHDASFYAEVVEVDDRQAARMADAENRARKDISAWERAAFLKHQLEHAYDRDGKRMREALKVEESLCSRLLNLSAWPADLAAAWGDPRLITGADAARINPLLADDAARGALLAEADKIAAEQCVSAAGRPSIRPAEVRRRLLAVAPAGRRRREYRDDAGDLLLAVRSNTRQGLTLYVPAQDTLEHERLLTAIHKAVAKVRGGKPVDA